MVVRAADIEVCPLRDRSSAADLGCVGLEEVDLVEGVGISNTAEDDEEHHNQCSG